MLIGSPEAVQGRLQHINADVVGMVFCTGLVGIPEVFIAGFTTGGLDESRGEECFAFSFIASALADALGVKLLFDPGGGPNFFDVLS